MVTTATKSAAPLPPEAAVAPLLEQARQQAREVLAGVPAGMSLEVELAFDRLFKQWSRVTDHMDKLRNPPPPLPPTVRLPGSRY